MGAIYAIRHSLFGPIPSGVTADFLISRRVIEQRYRFVLAADAVAYEPFAKTSEAGFGRKVRVMTRGLRCGLLVLQLLWAIGLLLRNRPVGRHAPLALPAVCLVHIASLVATWKLLCAVIGSTAGRRSGRQTSSPTVKPLLLSPSAAEGS